jgi:hypothetical protein
VDTAHRPAWVWSWTPAQSQHRSLAATGRPVPVVRCAARTAISRPRRPCCPPAFAKRAAASGRVSALRPHGPLGRVRGVTRTGGVSTRTGTRCLLGQVRCPIGQVSRGVLLAVLPAAGGRSGGRPAGSTPPAPSGQQSRRRTAVCGAPVWPRATRRARPPAGRYVGATSGSGHGRPGGPAGPATPPGPASSPGE